MDCMVSFWYGMGLDGALNLETRTTEPLSQSVLGHFEAFYSSKLGVHGRGLRLGGSRGMALSSPLWVFSTFTLMADIRFVDFAPKF